jgi:hypothetical protein
VPHYQSIKFSSPQRRNKSGEILLRNLGSIMTQRIPALAACLICISCAVRPPLTIDTARQSLAPLFFADSLHSLDGSGDVVFARNGEQISASFDLQWDGDTSFSMQFYGPVGMMVASVKPITAMRWAITAGDSQYIEHPSKPIRIGQGFLEYRLTWEELLRALTGRYPCRDDMRERPDSMSAGRKMSVFAWTSRRFLGTTTGISATVENKTCRLTEITYIAGKKGGVRMVFGGFNGGFAKEIKFSSSDNNYFYVKYRMVKINPRKVSIR